jgi:hypothetical protein
MYSILDLRIFQTYTRNRNWEILLMLLYVSVSQHVSAPTGQPQELYSHVVMQRDIITSIKFLSYDSCCDTERYNNINKISQLRLRVYVCKILTCTLRNRMHPTKILFLTTKLHCFGDCCLHHFGFCLAPSSTLNRIHRINAHSWVRTHIPSVRAGEDGSCLRPRGHCDRRDTK